MNIRRVLLVDDENDIRTIAELALSAVGGWNVTTAASGPDALAWATRIDPDLILLDVMMPGMDGPTTLARLRADERTRGIPVIFMTAKVQKPEVARYLELGALGVISKPFDPMTLSDQVRRLTTDVEVTARS